MAAANRQQQQQQQQQQRQQQQNHARPTTILIHRGGQMATVVSAGGRSPTTFAMHSAAQIDQATGDLVYPWEIEAAMASARGSDPEAVEVGGVDECDVLEEDEDEEWEHPSLEKRK